MANNPAEPRIVSFPTVPTMDDEGKELPQSLVKYMTDLQVVLQDALKGSMYLEQTFENGIIGN